MKNSFIKCLFISLLFSVSVFAQESAVELFNAGNAAYGTKDYNTALTKWEAYLAHPDVAVEQVESVTYKIADAANRAKNTEKARTYFQKCIDLGYRADISMFKLGTSYKTEDPAKYISIMETCVKEFPNSKYHKKYFVGSVAAYYNKAASEIFNKANAEAQTAAANTTTYVSSMKAKVLPLFAQAEEAFNKTLSFDASNSTATNAIANINAQRDSLKAYEAQLAAQKK